MDDVDKILPSLLGEQVAEGGEAHVYYKGNTLVKSIGLDYYILPVLALDRIVCTMPISRRRALMCWASVAQAKGIFKSL